jgi:hypothetical protein
MPGVPEDGRQCEQDAKIIAALQTQVVSIAVKKPGVSRDILRAIIQATGERPYRIGLNVNMSRLDGSAWPTSRLVVGAVTDVPTDQPSVSAFGHFIEWNNPYPPPYLVANLDEVGKYSDRMEQEFKVRLECKNKLDCATDGDVIETIVSAHSHEDARVGSQVTILTTVESLVSCENSKVRITQAGKIVHGNSVSAENALTIRVQAVDVDGFMISRTRAEIEFRCSNQTLPLQPWSPGSNEYFAEIPADFLLQLGQFDLVVRALNGWNQTLRDMAPCNLLQISMLATVSQPFNATWILVGLLIVIPITLIAGLVLYWYSRPLNAVKRRAVRRQQLLRELQKKYDMTGELGLSDGINSDGDLPLHIALEYGAHTLVRAILSRFPESAKIADARGNLPLHILLHGLSSQTQCEEANSSMRLLLAAFPGGKLQLDMHSKLPIQIMLASLLQAAVKLEWS